MGLFPLTPTLSLGGGEGDQGSDFPEAPPVEKEGRGGFYRSASLQAPLSNMHPGISLSVPNAAAAGCAPVMRPEGKGSLVRSGPSGT